MEEANMENLDVEFRTVLVRVADRISTSELQSLRFIFSDHIRRDDNDHVAVNFFQQLLDRNIINRDNFSTLINALEVIACHPAARLLKSILHEILNEYLIVRLDYQEPSSIHQSLWKDICDDEQFDKQSTDEFTQEIDRKFK